MVTGTLNNMFTTDGNKYTLNSNVFQTENIQSFANLAGALTTDGINYAMTGSMTLNVLNASTIAKWLKIEQNTPSSDENKSLFGQRPVSGGLVELTLGEGAGLRIGSGGTGISLSMLASALAGLGEAAKVGSWKYGGIEKKTTLNSINMLSYVSDSNVAKEI